MIDDPIIYCRVCVRYKKVSFATYRLDGDGIRNWNLCTHHYELIQYTLPLQGVKVTELPQGEVGRRMNAAEQQIEMEKHGR